MSMSAKTSSGLQAYQMIVYNRALHPELFPLRARRVYPHNGYELEGWLMRGGHLLRFEHHTLCACELMTDQEKNPDSGVVTAFLCAGEHDVEHSFVKDKVTYISTVQSETLSDNLYAATLEEMTNFGRDSGALQHTWTDETGRSLSLIDVQLHSREVHAQAYHLISSGGIVIRTQTIFELA